MGIGLCQLGPSKNVCDGAAITGDVATLLLVAYLLACYVVAQSELTDSWLDIQIGGC